MNLNNYLSRNPKECVTRLILLKRQFVDILHDHITMNFVLYLGTAIFLTAYIGKTKIGGGGGDSDTFFPQRHLRWQFLSDRLGVPVGRTPTFWQARGVLRHFFSAAPSALTIFKRQIRGTRRSNSDILTSKKKKKKGNKFCYNPYFFDEKFF